MKAFVVMVVMVALGSAWGSQSSYSTSEEEPLRRLCGWRLANKLNRVCKGVYNNPRSTGNYLYYRNKRGDGEREQRPPPEDLLDPLPDRFLTPSQHLPPRETSRGVLETLLPHHAAPQQDEDPSARFPFLTEADASQMVRDRPRFKRGLSAECCRKVCTVSELVGYCY